MISRNLMPTTGNPVSAVRTAMRQGQLMMFWAGLVVGSAAYAIDSKPLSDAVNQGRGAINLLKDSSSADLEAYRQDNGGDLSFGIKINETKKGAETAQSNGVSLKDAVLTLDFGDGREKTYSISNGACHTETYSLLNESGDSARKPSYTLLGSENSDREGAKNTVQNAYDSTLKCHVPDTLDDSGKKVKVVKAALNVNFLQTDTNKGDPESFYDFSGAAESLCLLNAEDSRFIDQYQSGGLQAPAKAETHPAPVADPLAVKSWNYFPAGGSFYFVAYEDMYPAQGDYDFNDAVVAYQVQVGLNSSNQVVKIVGNAYLVAKGAAYSHDWHLRIGLPPTAKAAVSCTTSLPTAPQTGFACAGTNPLASTGTADVTVFADTRTLFPNTLFTDYRKPLTNTLQWPVQARTFQLGPKSTFSINLAQPLDPAAMGAAPFDPYLYVRDTKKTVQLLQVNPSIKDANGYPYAMLMPNGWNWPFETVDIRTAYTKFNAFASSQGTSSVNWYGLPATAQIFPSPKQSVWAW